VQLWTKACFCLSSSCFAHSNAERVILENLNQSAGEAADVLGLNREPCLSVAKPIAYAPNVERNDRLSPHHRLNADDPKALRIHRGKSHHSGSTQIGVQLCLVTPAKESYGVA